MTFSTTSALISKSAVYCQLHLHLSEALRRKASKVLNLSVKFYANIYNAAFEVLNNFYYLYSF